MMQRETTPPLTLPLDASTAALKQVGGKGASLAKLAAAGLPVPPGFHITTAAYHRFVAANDLQGAIVAAATDVSVEDPGSQERAAATIRALFEVSAMPDEVAVAIRRAYAELSAPEPAVAVRSSATAEDLPEASFAGQQETYLNVRGERGLLAAVRSCWASLWTARAIGYRRRMGIDERGVALAVVVQRLVPADVSGVLFTADPTTGERTAMLVNAAWGLGESIVGGEVTPDAYRIDKTSLRVTEVTLGTKALMVISA